MKKHACAVLLVCLSIFTLHTETAAQTPYVNVSGLFDAVQASGLLGIERRGGQTFGGAVRVGIPVGSAWGVELDVGRNGNIREFSPLRLLADPEVLANLPFDAAAFPDASGTADVQVTSFTTTLWWRRRVNDRFDLRYLGGAAFARKRTRTEIVPSPSSLPPHLSGIQDLELEEVDYSLGVAAGLEAGIRLTERLRFVPGMRLLAVPSTWVVRTTAGMQWTF